MPERCDHAGRVEPRGVRENDRGNGWDRCVIRNLCERLTVLLAARWIDRIGRTTRRHLLGSHRRRRVPEIERADIRCHRDLLEQQTEQRNQCDAATGSVAAKAIHVIAILAQCDPSFVDPRQAGSLNVKTPTNASKTRA